MNNGDQAPNQNMVNSKATYKMRTNLKQTCDIETSDNYVQHVQYSKDNITEIKNKFIILRNSRVKQRPAKCTSSVHYVSFQYQKF